MATSFFEKRLSSSWLGVVYTMDHEVVWRPCKICNWLLSSSHHKRHNPSYFTTTCHSKHLGNMLTFMPVQCTGVWFFFFFSWAHPKTTLVYTKEKFVKVTMMFKIPKRRNLGPTLTTNMIQHGFAVGEAKEALYKRKRQAGTTTNKCRHNKPWPKCFLEKRKRRKEKTREWSNFLFSLSLSLSPKITLFWTYIKHTNTLTLLVHGPFLLVHIQFSPNEEPKDFVNWFFKKTRPWKLDHSKRPSSIVHGVNRPL